MHYSLSPCVLLKAHCVYVLRIQPQCPPKAYRHKYVTHPDRLVLFFCMQTYVMSEAIVVMMGLNVMMVQNIFISLDFFLSVHFLPSFLCLTHLHHQLNVSDTNGYFENVRARRLFGAMDNLMQYGKRTDKTRCGCYDNYGSCYRLPFTRSKVTLCVGALLIGGTSPLLLLTPTTAHHSINLVGTCTYCEENAFHLYSYMMHNNECGYCMQCIVLQVCSTTILCSMHTYVVQCQWYKCCMMCICVCMYVRSVIYVARFNPVGCCAVPTCIMVRASLLIHQLSSSSPSLPLSHSHTHTVHTCEYMHTRQSSWKGFCILLSSTRSGQSESVYCIVHMIVTQQSYGSHMIVT